MNTRYVRKDRRVHHDAHCRLCGTYHGVVRPEIEHRGTTCMYCGSRQCMGNGLGHGTCSICYVGLLPGWHGNETTCRYKGCNKPAVARGRNGKSFVCIDHAKHQYGADHIAQRLAERDRQWVEVQDSPNSPY